MSTSYRKVRATAAPIAHRQRRLVTASGLPERDSCSHDGGHRGQGVGTGVAALERRSSMTRPTCNPAAVRRTLELVWSRGDRAREPPDDGRSLEGGAVRLVGRLTTPQAWPRAESDRGLLDKRDQWRERLNVIIREPEARRQVVRIVVAEPRATVAVLPRKRLERQIDRGQRRRHHEGRPAARVAEDQYLTCAHAQSRLRRACAVIDAGEDCHAARLEERLEPIEGWSDAVRAWTRDDTLGGHGH
jgi:hypothetical protein